MLVPVGRRVLDLLAIPFKLCCLTTTLGELQLETFIKGIVFAVGVVITSGCASFYAMNDYKGAVANYVNQRQEPLGDDEDFFVECMLDKQYKLSFNSSIKSCEFDVSQKVAHREYEARVATGEIKPLSSSELLELRLRTIDAFYGTNK